MGRAPCCDKANVKRGPWSPEEDATLKRYIETHGTGGNWIALPQKAGLKRCGKSCRLRWLNYLRPNIKHGGFTEAEDDIICTLYSQMGSRWSVISSQLPGRTDNDVKNYWNTKLKKRHHAAKTSVSIKGATDNMVPANGNDSSFPCLPPSPQYCDPKAVANTVVFSDYSVNGTSVTLPTFSDIGYEAVDPQSIGLSSLQFSFPGVMDVPGFGTSTLSSHIVSSSEEASSISASSFAMDSKCLSFLSKGGLDDIGMLMDTQYDFARDITFGFPLQDKTDEVALTCYLAELGYIRPQVPSQGLSNHY